MVEGYQEAVDSLTEELDAEEEDIRDDLQELLAFSVPLEEAKDSVRRRYHDD